MLLISHFFSEYIYIIQDITVRVMNERIGDHDS